MGKEGPSEEDRIMMEIKIFSLASHLFWGLWSIVNAKLSEIPFGYWVSVSIVIHKLSRSPFTIIFITFTGLRGFSTEKLPILEGEDHGVRTTDDKQRDYRQENNGGRLR